MKAYSEMGKDELLALKQIWKRLTMSLKPRD